jgi:hypothetical protein
MGNHLKGIIFSEAERRVRNLFKVEQKLAQNFGKIFLNYKIVFIYF